MIDENVLIEFFEKMKKKESCRNRMFNVQGVLYFIDKVIDKIKKCPKVDKWILCSDEKPDIQEQVLACEDNGERWIAIYTGECWLEDVQGFAIQPVAWQPLPEAYKPEVKDWRNQLLNKFLKQE